MGASAQQRNDCPLALGRAGTQLCSARRPAYMTRHGAAVCGEGTTRARRLAGRDLEDALFGTSAANARRALLAPRPAKHATLPHLARSRDGGVSRREGLDASMGGVMGNKKELFTLLDLCVSSLRRGHANLLCIVPILTDDPRRESDIYIARGSDRAAIWGPGAAWPC